MQLDFYQVDAFTDTPFTGNPAIIYCLGSWLGDGLMQRIANEHHLAETAFVVPEGAGWRIRWFTPVVEVPLCGHATLAAAHVLRVIHHADIAPMVFQSRSGELRVSEERGRLWLDMPAETLAEKGVSLGAQRALGGDIVDVLDGKNLVVVLPTEQHVLACRPDFGAIAQLPWPGVVVTARGEQHDFVSRYFAPQLGIFEDPATGSTHCALVPYWSERLNKTSLRARQCSARGGELWCRLEGERVIVGGDATLVAKGQLLTGLPWPQGGTPWPAPPSG
ncbi:PhzF family phenazine biosynthesis protein [Pseudomonas typographi]|uniref:PhzF family phenazine biosynthesis protein n=1 Tax=Pseudomonas typographi TaxID=2715964 RepID=UPI001685106F|nr:PhzF family phenazine biosynthesis protein [Pseudomonas typographi]MBD1550614.1 PhzF family phenazine biosynthesis protein [Pseudomonas typographi]